MVHGATSGIGVTAIQMAKAAGAKVIATGRGADKAARPWPWAPTWRSTSPPRTSPRRPRPTAAPTWSLDMVGGDYVAKELEALNPGGRLVMIATQAGANVEVDLLKIMQKRLVLTGSTLRPRSADEKARLAAAVEARGLAVDRGGQAQAVIDQTFPLAEAAKAHARVESGGHVGKVILVP